MRTAAHVYGVRNSVHVSGCGAAVDITAPRLGGRGSAGAAQQPPATAGMIETLAPSPISVARPSAKRTSSSFT